MFTVLKMHLKTKNNIVIHGDNKNFSIERLSLNLSSEIEKYLHYSFYDIHCAFITILVKKTLHYKKRYIRANQ